MQHGGTRRQFITTSAADLAAQINAAAPGLPRELVTQLARLTITHRARVELPDLVTVRHVNTLSSAAPVEPPRAQVQQASQPNDDNDQAQQAAAARPAFRPAGQPISSDDQAHDERATD